MTTIELGEEETALLQEVLEEYLSDLRAEIVDTDNYGYKLMLKDRKILIMRIQKALTESQPELAGG